MTTDAINRLRGQKMVKSIGGKVFAIQTEWLRIAQNPAAPRYPRSGTIVTLVRHRIVPSGRYLIKMVEEFEPPFTKDEDGRDIRISITDGTTNWEGLNGVGVRQAITASDTLKLKLTDAKG